MTEGTRVLLTGAAGFIGRQVARRLLTDGCDLTAVVRPGPGRDRLADLPGRFRVLECDLEDPVACLALGPAAEPEVLIHAGWYAGPGDLDSPRHPAFLAGSLALLRGLAGTPCRRVVVAGTSLEYDTDLGYVSESTPVRPRTLYGSSKAALALLGAPLGKPQGWTFSQARIFNVYGPGEDPRRLVPHVARCLLRGEPCEVTAGGQVRDYLHVDDVASALVAIAEADVEGPVNVGSSCPITVAALARSVATLLGGVHLLRVGARPPRPGDYPFLCADTRLLRERVGWSPRFDLESGLAQTIAWWKEHLDPSGRLRDAEDVP